MQNIHIYIHFPENLDSDINTQEEGIKKLKEFQMAIDLADCERGSSLFYCKSNKDTFFENIQAYEELSQLSIGAYDFETFVNSLLNENNVLPVRESNNTGCMVSTFNSLDNSLGNDVPVIFFDIVEKRNLLKDIDKRLILNLFKGIFLQNPILIIINCNMTADTLEVPFVISFESLYNWLKESRVARNYNFNDNRHIENHHQSQINSHNKSPLIGGIEGKQNASNLLDDAIGDKRYTNDLINFDTNNFRFIWYKFENNNPQNQYHGYHLAKSGTYEEDLKAIHEIPKRVKKILEYRQQIENGHSHP